MTPYEARDKIKTHLKRCGKRDVTVTDKMIKQWWNVCNIACFDGQLQPPVNFILVDEYEGDDNHAVAWCIPVVSYKPDVIISMIKDLESREMFLTLLVHEMVHQWEWELYRNCGHGKRFISWEKFIAKELGLTLSEYVG